MRDDSLEQMTKTVTLQNMKTTKYILTATLAGIALLTLVGQTIASDIAASPRLQQQLNDQQKAFTVAVVATDAKSASCAMCEDRYVTRFDPSVRGAVKYTTVVERGACTHSCTAAGKDAPCCSGMKKASN
jgi:hypothetical protein